MFSKYTLDQLRYMGKYEMYLIELGEKSYSDNLGDGWAVEVRICITAIINAALFILTQLLTDKISAGAADNLRDIIDNYLTKGNSKGVDILRMADEATAENQPIPSNTDATPPLGVTLGELLAQLTGGMTAGGDNNILSQLLGALTGSQSKKPTETPKMKRPTTFARRRKNKP